jgi:hypothetical protein
MSSEQRMWLPNNSLERTRPARESVLLIALPGRSARSR